jgi:hypothetical protein
MPGLVPGIHVFVLRIGDVNDLDTGEQKRRRPSDGYAGHDAGSVK